MKSLGLRSLLAGGVCAASLLSTAHAGSFKIGAGDLESALDSYASQTGANLVVSYSEIKGVRTGGAVGTFSNEEALSKILAGTGFAVRKDASGVIKVDTKNAGFVVTNVPVGSHVVVSGKPLKNETGTISATRMTYQ